MQGFSSKNNYVEYLLTVLSSLEILQTMHLINSLRGLNGIYSSKNNNLEYLLTVLLSQAAKFTNHAINQLTRGLNGVGRLLKNTVSPAADTGTLGITDNVLQSFGLRDFWHNVVPCT